MALRLTGSSTAATPSTWAWITGKPLVLLEDGVIYRKNLKKAKLDLNEFLTYCRIGGWFDLSQLQTAGNTVKSSPPPQRARKTSPSSR